MWMGLFRRRAFNQASYPCAHWILRNHKNIRTKIGNMVGDIEVHAVNDGHHNDQRGGGDHDAEEREEGAKLMARARPPRRPRRLREP